MTLLSFSHGESFATGAIGYDYRPATKRETTNRILLPIEIQGARTLAILDTGAPYVICAPDVASDAGVDRAAAIRDYVDSRNASGGSAVSFEYEISCLGDNLDVDATVFVPDSEYLWGDFPSFIGLSGFLERIRFAIDPNADTFYFGQL